MITESAYLVTRVGLENRGTQANFWVWSPSTTDRDESRHIPTSLFLNRADAERELRNRLIEFLRELNPFDQAGRLEYRTSLEPAEFSRRVVGLGCAPPPASTNWKPMREWWATAVAPAPDDVLLAVWEMFDKNPLWTIIEIPLED